MNATETQTGGSLARLVRRIQRQWDWWVYFRAFHSLRRMTKDNPGMAYLMELHLRDHNSANSIPEPLKRATERFHEACQAHVPNDKRSDRT